jgi:hypothetical protein
MNVPPLIIRPLTIQTLKNYNCPNPNNYDSWLNDLSMNEFVEENNLYENNHTEQQNTSQYLNVKKDSNGINQVVTAGQHLDYEFRGEQLKHLNLYEFTGLIRNEKRKVKLSDMNDGPGRPQNNQYVMDKDHIFHESKANTIVTKTSVPIMAGGYFPKHPGSIIYND